MPTHIDTLPLRAATRHPTIRRPALWVVFPLVLRLPSLALSARMPADRTFESSADYDPAPHLDAITKPILAINFADDLLNPPELLSWPRRSNVVTVLLPGGYGHQTLAHPDLWAPALTKFLSMVPGWR